MDKIKSALKRLGALIAEYPIFSVTAIAAVVILLLFAYFKLGSTVFEHGVNKADAVRVEQHKEVDEFQKEADTSYGESQVHHAQVEQSDRRLTAIKKEVQDKKDNAEKAHSKTLDTGHRDIGDADVPSNGELCARANSLGVRCDQNK
jgi:hypothetical protein